VSAGLDKEAACRALGVDSWALERLIERGELEAEGADGARVFEEAAVQACAAARTRRRMEALETLADLDGPHLGGAR
jgi:hypothetical protein